MTIQGNKKIKNYTVLEKFPAGIWGVLNRVKHGKSGKVFALKQLSCNCPLDYQSLLQEFKLLTSLKHENLSGVHSLDMDSNGYPFFITEFIPGSPITSVMKDSESARKQFDSIATQICDALDYLHQRGFNHHDLHPNNILLHKEGKNWKVTITDYGLYNIVGCPDIFQRNMDNKLTYAAYLSPEIITGNSPDHRSDYYSLGVILYEILTGTNPFAKNSLQSIISSHINHHPVPPSNLDKSVTDPQNSIILQMLAKEPSFRPAGADVIKNTLQTGTGSGSDMPILTTGMFVGQNLPLKEMREAFEAACQGQGKILLVHGEKGIGKTRLLQEIRADFLLSGAQIIDISYDKHMDSSREMFRHLFEKLSQFNSRISRDLTALIYRRGFRSILLHPLTEPSSTACSTMQQNASYRTLKSAKMILLHLR